MTDLQIILIAVWFTIFLLETFLEIIFNESIYKYGIKLFEGTYSYSKFPSIAELKTEFKTQALIDPFVFFEFNQNEIAFRESKFVLNLGSLYIPTMRGLMKTNHENKTFQVKGYSKINLPLIYILGLAIIILEKEYWALIFGIPVLVCSYGFCYFLQRNRYKKLGEFISTHK